MALLNFDSRYYIYVCDLHDCIFRLFSEFIYMFNGLWNFRCDCIGIPCMQFTMTVYSETDLRYKFCPLMFSHKSKSFYSVVNGENNIMTYRKLLCFVIYSKFTALLHLNDTLLFYTMIIFEWLSMRFGCRLCTHTVISCIVSRLFFSSK